MPYQSQRLWSTASGSAEKPGGTTEELNDSPVEDSKDELTQLYDVVLSQVPKHGWTDTAIAEAVKELGWSIAATRMIARGPVQVAEEFVRRCNKRLALELNEKVGKEGPLETDGADYTKAVYAIRERINMVEPFHKSWSRALALQALPQNVPIAVRSSAMLVDEVAHFAGYRQPNVSLEINFFSSTTPMRQVY